MVRLVSSQFLFINKNERSQFDYYKVTFVPTGVDHFFGIHVLKNSQCFLQEAREFTTDPGEQHARELIQTTFINDKLFSNE